MKLWKKNSFFSLKDVITSGGSVLETAEILQKEGLKVQDAIIFLDREQGGKTNLENNGIKVHSVVTATELLNILHEAGKIDAKQKFEVEEFLKSTQIWRVIFLDMIITKYQPHVLLLFILSAL